MPAPDALLFDFSDSGVALRARRGREDGQRLAEDPLLLHHWGCVDAPDFAPFNGDPASLPGLVDNPERIVILAPARSTGTPPTR